MQNGTTADTRTTSGATGNVNTFTFLNGPGVGTTNSNYRAAIRDNNDNPDATNFTRTLQWEVQTGENGLAAGTSFVLTLDGSPFIPVPEPSSFALFASALILPVLRRKRKS